MTKSEMLAAWDRAVAAFWRCEEQGGFHASELDSKKEWNAANGRLLDIDGFTLPHFAARGGRL